MSIIAIINIHFAGFFMGQLKKIKNIHFAGTVDANHLPPGHHSWMPGVTIPGWNDDHHKDDNDRLENGDDHHYEDVDDHHD